MIKQIRLLSICLIIFFIVSCRPAAFTMPDDMAVAAERGLKQNLDLPAKNQSASEAEAIAIAPAWEPLAVRLANDGLSGPDVRRLLATLGDKPTQAPMGRKIRELYLRKFFPKPSSKMKERYYKGVVTAANAKTCNDFLLKHNDAFIQAKRRYDVPPHIAVALLFVETRLGTVLGDVPENAFFTLASMSVCSTPESISSWLKRLPKYEQHLSWLTETMNKRADWAYREVRSLIEYMLHDKVSPDNLPGSIYGAVGLCQFMPSNIRIYGDDGDGDGRIDLFTVPDAVSSLAKYLHSHGWEAGISRAKQHKVLMAYNHSRIYANTILALGDLVLKISADAKSASRASDND